MIDSHQCRRNLACSLQFLFIISVLLELDRQGAYVLVENIDQLLNLSIHGGSGYSVPRNVLHFRKWYDKRIEMCLHRYHDTPYWHGNLPSNPDIGELGLYRFALLTQAVAFCPSSLTRAIASAWWQKWAALFDYIAEYNISLPLTCTKSFAFSSFLSTGFWTQLSKCIFTVAVWCPT